MQCYNAKCRQLSHYAERRNAECHYAAMLSVVAPVSTTIIESTRIVPLFPQGILNSMALTFEVQIQKLFAQILNMPIK